MSAHPIESKVTAAGTTSAAVVLVLYLLNEVDYIASMDDLAKGALAVITTGVVTTIAGYAAKHTRRPDLDHATLDPVEPGPIPYDEPGI